MSCNGLDLGFSQGVWPGVLDFSEEVNLRLVMPKNETSREQGTSQF